MKDKLPSSPLTDMETAAAQLHEMYSSFRWAGFSRSEALYLTAAVLTNNNASGN